MAQLKNAKAHTHTSDGNNRETSSFLPTSAQISSFVESDATACPPNYNLLGGPSADGRDQSNHVISSESSVASANTLVASAKFNVIGASGYSAVFPMQTPPGAATPGLNSLMKQVSDETAASRSSTSSLTGGISGVDQESSTSNEEKQDYHREFLATACSDAQNPNAADASGDSANRSPLVLQISAPPHPVAEFLFQLTKMLTDNNTEYIEWKHASIFVHDPPVSIQLLFFSAFRHFIRADSNMTSICVCCERSIATGSREKHPAEILPSLELFQLRKSRLMRNHTP